MSVSGRAYLRLSEGNVFGSYDWKHACHEINMLAFMLEQQMISSSRVKWEKQGFWGGLHHDPSEGVASRICPTIQHSRPLEHHPLPQFCIWEMGGSPWNYCVTKIANSYFL